MKKLKLSLDALQVDSFTVFTELQQRQTVRGAEYGQEETIVTGDGGSTYFSCTTPYPTNEHTCQGSCNGTCGYTCHPDPDVQCI